MAWNRIQRLAERNYIDDNERQAFRRGYSDGFHSFPRMTVHAWLNAYSAGYWEGHADNHATSEKWENGT